jgi:type IV pilus assembly protein PilA
MKNNKKGFTLAELLIVVAIIAVLVAISIPVFTAQLEKAREATDAANLRAAYAEMMADALTNETTTGTKTVTQKQTVSNWATAPTWPENFTVSNPKDTSGTWTLSYTLSNSLVTGVTAANN